MIASQEKNGIPISRSRCEKRENESLGSRIGFQDPTAEGKEWLGNSWRMGSIQGNNSYGY
jgi:hypothetical protein